MQHHPSPLPGWPYWTKNRFRPKSRVSHPFNSGELPAGTMDGSNAVYHLYGDIGFRVGAISKLTPFIVTPHPKTSVCLNGPSIIRSAADSGNAVHYFYRFCLVTVCFIHNCVCFPIVAQLPVGIVPHIQRPPFDLIAAANLSPQLAETILSITFTKFTAFLPPGTPLPSWPHQLSPQIHSEPFWSITAEIARAFSGKVCKGMLSCQFACSAGGRRMR